MLKKILTLIALCWAVTAWAAVDVNKASAADLDGLKGIGPSTSARILDERKKGEFKDWNDLIDRIKGLNTKRAVKLSEAGLTVNGAGFKPDAASAKGTGAGSKPPKQAGDPKAASAPKS